MIIPTHLTQAQLNMVNNLYMNCTDKMDMFDHLLCKVGINAFHANLMANSYSPLKYSHSIISLVKQCQRKTYHCEAGKVVLVEV